MPADTAMSARFRPPVRACHLINRDAYFRRRLVRLIKEAEAEKAALHPRAAAEVRPDPNLLPTH
jgi:hypothetical protein